MKLRNIIVNSLVVSIFCAVFVGIAVLLVLFVNFTITGNVSISIFEYISSITLAVFLVINLINFSVVLLYRANPSIWDSMHKDKEKVPLLKLMPDISNIVKLLEHSINK